MATGDTRWRVGIDTGGTFADLVVRPPGDAPVRTAKLPRDAGPDRLADALVALGVSGPALVVHGTTQVTNAVLEGSFARTALVTTRGFADVLRIGRQARDDLYDLGRPARRAAIVPPELTFELDERCTPDGTVVEELADAQLAELAAWVRESDVEAVAVCLLHAYANPSHERRVGAALRDGVTVSLSHEVSAEAREFERAAATALNVAVRDSTRAYVGALSDAIGRALPEAQLFVVGSSGGMLPTEAVSELPLRTVMSGPAAGVAAVSHLARRTGIEQAVAFDMGGTSTDVAFVLGGAPATARQRHVAGHVVRVPSVAVQSIAVGGGSIVALDDVGALTVGPRSAGATPGPAAYDRGGTEPTITDAALVCGLIGAGGDAPGLALRRDLAERALGDVAARMDLGVDDLAWRAVDVAQGLMGHALQAIVTRRGYDLRACTLVAYGGGGPVHAGPLAARTGIARVLIPALAPVLSALGCCLAEVGVEAVRGTRRILDDDALADLEPLADEVVRSEAAVLGADPALLRVTRRLELRYRGQNAELPVVWPPGARAAGLAEAFSAAHRQEYGFATDDPIEVMALSCRLELADEQSWPTSLADAAPAGGEWSLLLPGGERRSVPVLDATALEGFVEGPAILALPFGSVTVWTDQRASADPDGGIVLEALT
jgi:N-methylhydantoinase A